MQSLDLTQVRVCEWVGGGSTTACRGISLQLPGISKPSTEPHCLLSSLGRGKAEEYVWAEFFFTEVTCVILLVCMKN